MIALSQLQLALKHYDSFFGQNPQNLSSDSSGFTQDDVDIVSAHISYRILLSRGPAPIPPEPDPEGIEAAFANLRRFTSAWPSDRIDAASGLTKEDLDLIGEAEFEPIFCEPFSP